MKVSPALLSLERQTLTSAQKSPFPEVNTDLRIDCFNTKSKFSGFHNIRTVKLAEQKITINNQLLIWSNKR